MKQSLVSVRQRDLKLQELITGTHKVPLVIQVYRNPTHFKAQPPLLVIQE